MNPATENEKEEIGFYDPETETWLSTAQLRAADEETQLRAAQYWFYDNYTNPAENTPYDSAEGGYQFIWGGPYVPKDVLQENFEGVVRDEVIDELADMLSDISFEWTGNPDEHVVADYLFDTQITGAEFSLQLALETIEISLAEFSKSTHLGEAVRMHLLRMLYGNVITVLEAYLFDFFVSALKKDEKLLRVIVETNKDFQAKKVPLSEVFKHFEGIDATVQEFLLGLSWHNLPRVEPLFEDVLGIEFEDQHMNELQPAILVRHDIIHRNGKTKDGAEVTIAANDVVTLIRKVRAFMQSIESQWAKNQEAKTPHVEP